MALKVQPSVKTVVFHPDGRVLVTWKRKPRLYRTRKPTAFDLPGGKVDLEDYRHERLTAHQAAAVREVKEETGLKVRILGEASRWRFERPDKGDVLVGRTYACLLAKPRQRVVLSREQERHEWRSPKKLSDAPGWLRDDVRKALAHFKKRKS